MGGGVFGILKKTNMKHENDLDAVWYSVEATKNGFTHLFKERAYTSSDCIAQSKLFLEGEGYKVKRVYPMLQNHSGNKQFYQIRHAH